MTALKLQTYCLNPLVAVIDDVFTAETAAQAIAAGKQDLERAGVVFGAESIVHEGRTNSQAMVDQWQDPVLTDLVTKISTLVRLPPENAETAKLLCYTGEQKFDPHFDAFEPQGLQSPQLNYGGQRLFTTLCYLNDVEGDGGMTVFPALKIAVRPRLGRVLLFSNTVPGHLDPHPHAIHAGENVAGAEKWVLSVWWREQLYHIPRQYPEAEGEAQIV